MFIEKSREKLLWVQGKRLRWVEGDGKILDFGRLFNNWVQVKLFQPFVSISNNPHPPI